MSLVGLKDFLKRPYLVEEDNESDFSSSERRGRTLGECGCSPGRYAKSSNTTTNNEDTKLFIALTQGTPNMIRFAQDLAPSIPRIFVS